ncbi:SAV_2336 N-terminal domain-related protein [Streptomyces cellulosae]
MIEELFNALRDAQADVGPEELADIIWLATRISAAPDTGEGSAADDPGHAPVDHANAELPEADAKDRGEHQLHNDDPGASLGEQGGHTGESVLVQRAPALDDPLGIMRALRPLGKRTTAAGHIELDEEATVRASVERRMLVPVLRPLRGRWLDLVMVVDAHHTMVFWHDVVSELCRAVTQTGLFRDVRVWYLGEPGPTGVPTVSRTPGGEPHSPQELTDPSGHRLVLIVTDTVAEGWGGPTMARALRRWAAHGPVAVVNVMPRRLWDRGAVTPVGMLVRAARPAAPNGTWRLHPGGRRTRPGRDRAGHSIAIPVVEAVPGSLAALASLIAGSGQWMRMTCLSIDRTDSATPPEPSPAPTQPPAAIPSAESALQRFQATASPPARRLAGHLAAVPLTLPVMTLVRRAMVKDSDHGHVAEVALGGLLQSWHPLPPHTDLDRYTFQFLPGVREALLGGQGRQDITAVQELVRGAVSAYLERVPGTGGEFRAVRVVPHTARGNRTVAQDSMPFAHARGPGDAPVGDPLDEARLWTVTDRHPYIPRHFDAQLRSVLQQAERGTSRFLVVTGPPGAGKTRSTWEAVRRLPRDWRLWEPRSAEEFLEGASRVGPRTVVWLDDVAGVITSGGRPDIGDRAVQRVIELVEDTSRAPILIIAMRLAKDETHPFVYAEERADHIFVESAARAEELDPADADRVVARFEGAPALARAVVLAALDARSLGIGPALPAQLLAEAAPGYMRADVRSRLAEDWLESAFAYLLPTGNELALLLPEQSANESADNLRFRLHNHLGTARRPPQELPPDELLNALLHRCIPEELSRIGRVLKTRGNSHWAAEFENAAAAATTDGSQTAAPWGVPVVRITADGVTGSGVVVGNVVLTAHHLVGQASRITVTRGRGRYAAELQAAQPQSDVAVLQITDAHWHGTAAEETTNTSPRITSGQRVRVIGFTKGHPDGVHLECVLTNPAGSRLGQLILEPVTTGVSVQTSSFLGLSGAPVMDARDQLVGLVTTMGPVTRQPTRLLAAPVSSFQHLLGGPAKPAPQRHLLLPSLRDSQAVLVTSDSSDPTTADLRVLLTEREKTPAFAPESVTSVRNPPEPLEILDQLRRAAASARDVLLFHFTGHGLLDDGGELYLSPSSTDPESLPRTSVSARAINEILLASPARRQLVIVDCFHSDRWPDFGSHAAWVLGASTESLVQVLRTGALDADVSVMDLPVIHQELSRRRRDAGSPAPFLRGPSGPGVALCRNRAVPRPPRMEGAVKWFNSEKGYGFVTLDTGQDVFVHYSAVQMQGFRTLLEGQRVSLRLIEGAKGPQAEDVHVIS